MRIIRQIGIKLLAVTVLLVIGCGRSTPLAKNQSSKLYPTELEAFQYQYSPKLFRGSATSLGLNRNGFVSYSYASQPHTGSGGNTVVKEWHIPEQEAAQILDTLVNAGILELGMDGETKFPFHVFTLSSKGWQKAIRPTRLPDAVWKQILPLMMHAHPEMWKKDTQQDSPADTKRPQQ